jgi:hypothetical protein
MDGDATITRAELGWNFIHWGLGLFITGFVVGFIPILHYMHGAVAGDVGPAFLKNMTLWWGCPAILAELTLKTGALGMIAIGLCYRATIRQGASESISSHERIALTLCAYGLIAELVTAGVGYVVCNLLWPNFYFAAVREGIIAWLVPQGLSVAVYLVGVCYASAGVRRAAAQLR